MRQRQFNQKMMGYHITKAVEQLQGNNPDKIERFLASLVLAAENLENTVATSPVDNGETHLIAEALTQVTERWPDSKTQLSRLPLLKEIVGVRTALLHFSTGTQGTSQHCATAKPNTILSSDTVQKRIRSVIVLVETIGQSIQNDLFTRIDPKQCPSIPSYHAAIFSLTQITHHRTQAASQTHPWDALDQQHQTSRTQQSWHSWQAHTWEKLRLIHITMSDTIKQSGHVPAADLATSIETLEQLHHTTQDFIHEFAAESPGPVSNVKLASAYTLLGHINQMHQAQSTTIQADLDGDPSIPTPLETDINEDAPFQMHHLSEHTRASAYNHDHLDHATMQTIQSWHKKMDHLQHALDQSLLVDFDQYLQDCAPLKDKASHLAYTEHTAFSPPHWLGHMIDSHIRELVMQIPEDEYALALLKEQCPQFSALLAYTYQIGHQIIRDILCQKTVTGRAFQIERWTCAMQYCLQHGNLMAADAIVSPLTNHCVQRLRGTLHLLSEKTITTLNGLDHLAISQQMTEQFGSKFVPLITQDGEIFQRAMTFLKKPTISTQQAQWLLQALDDMLPESSRTRLQKMITNAMGAQIQPKCFLPDIEAISALLNKQQLASDNTQYWQTTCQRIQAFQQQIIGAQKHFSVCRHLRSAGQLTPPTAIDEMPCVPVTLVEYGTTYDRISHQLEPQGRQAVLALTEHPALKRFIQAQQLPLHLAASNTSAIQAANRMLQSPRIVRYASFHRKLTQAGLHFNLKNIKQKAYSLYLCDTLKIHHPIITTQVEQDNLWLQPGRFYIPHNRLNNAVNIINATVASLPEIEPHELNYALQSLGINTPTQRETLKEAFYTSTDRLFGTEAETHNPEMARHNQLARKAVAAQKANRKASRYFRAAGLLALATIPLLPGIGHASHLVQSLLHIGTKGSLLVSMIAGLGAIISSLIGFFRHQESLIALRALNSHEQAAQRVPITTR